ncbi:MAG: hypothetical protein IPJ08_20270 [Burkholderiales bacterium]|nr:hypothetical protein [Burkholderiales bacterium]
MIATPQPLSLPRMVMRRAALVVVLALLLAALLGWLRARENVRAEVHAATALAQLMAQLGPCRAWTNPPPCGHWASWRHARSCATCSCACWICRAACCWALRVVALGDDVAGWPKLDGLVASRAGRANRGFGPWPVARGHWTVALTATPQSEQREAMDDLLGMLAVLSLAWPAP